MNRLSRFGRLARHAWLASGKQGVANLVTQTQVGIFAPSTSGNGYERSKKVLSQQTKNLAFSVI